jgi:hypothetical protein
LKTQVVKFTLFAVRLAWLKRAHNEQIALNLHIKLLRRESGDFDTDGHRSLLVPDVKPPQRIASLFVKEAIEETLQSVSQSDKKGPATMETEALDLSGYRTAVLGFEYACPN